MGDPAPVGRVIVVGDVMTDVIVIPEGPLVRGSDRRARIVSRAGGSGANQAVWLGAEGVPVRFVARVGAGDKPQLDGYFRGRKVEPLLVADPERASGVLVTIVDADGERSFLTDRGANLALSPTDLPVSLLDGARMLVLSGYSLFAEVPRGAVRGLASEALSRGMPVAVDAASVGFLREVGAARFRDWTRGFSLLFANAEEALVLTGIEGLAEQMQQLGADYQQVVIKLGAAGAAVGGRAGIVAQLPAPPVAVVDSTGAGDAFAAAYISAQLRGRGTADCLAAGIAAGSAAVTRVGGQPG